MKTTKSTILATVFVLMISGTAAFAKSGTISATKTGTISGTRTGTISGTRTGTISGTTIDRPLPAPTTSLSQPGLIATVSGSLNMGILEMVLKLYQLW